ncbi:MAG: hypothetical protein HYR96_11675 [Deltaproteobacteria bacterium]|nr:hypothetical protein [Deltaproteobacteria bacterium]MBI3294961.1 hypothetical protein [Deltaproteobacteria bacterium]
MCFSLEASFGMGAALIPAGGYCIVQAIKKDPKFLPLAAIPVAFGVQQLSEGLVWRGMETGNQSLVTFGSVIFLFFALPFWPFWIPLAASFLEKRPYMKRFCQIASVVGFLLGMGFYLPTAMHPADYLTTTTCLHSIHYDTRTLPFFEQFPVVFQTLYLAATAVPLFFSFDWKIRGFGFLVVLLAGAAHISYRYAFISVWCFFAAFLSFNLVILFYRMTSKSQIRISSPFWARFLPRKQRAQPAFGFSPGRPDQAEKNR